MPITRLTTTYTLTEDRLAQAEKVREQGSQGELL